MLDVTPAWRGDDVRLLNFMNDCMYGNEDALYEITRADRAAAFVPFGVFALFALAFGHDGAIAQSAGMVGVVLWAAFVLFWCSRISKARERDKRDQQGRDLSKGPLAAHDVG